MRKRKKKTKVDCLKKSIQVSLKLFSCAGETQVNIQKCLKLRPAWVALCIKTWWASNIRRVASSSDCRQKDQDQIRLLLHCFCLERPTSLSETSNSCLLHILSGAVDKKPLLNDFELKQECRGASTEVLMSSEKIQVRKLSDCGWEHIKPSTAELVNNLMDLFL